MKITMRTVRAAQCCSRGARAWFKRHNLDWSAFLREGIDADKVLATGCPIGERVVQKAREQIK